ncbi:MULTISPECIES: Crp/Fnr family transcriptional regulator [unclassified Candidatus Frackibacter]|uniref:Crp/Fnr family transcriptional regulator n=1 Tax=unclassified Candidatus Frackibacter TaxID=2648818 RepID=UPI000797A8AF|nr:MULTISPECIES: Crp/Fnr family transcriptional regulator [unclassified Candidatus Frackibacter]KXS43541.1 MAG: CRP/FNR family transcriptional regulator, anaerobic regulatory protein [Candidatus Frackibacter sp. T328-2]SDC53672.1 CRP/FNR family transcriptional regulator, anaerobic regulatory protein [Candidatus Frackibacter sp. WG11]SEM66007.1 CRP/FNR family transcriptional regulator, anaerobic regulatory protein [Candidatus Frackibacter sp. WG12]SFL77312.1 CRP/FNR family transcriptional regula
MNNISYLKKIPFFEGLTIDELEQINELIIMRNYKKGMFIFLEHEPGEALYFIKTGQVKLSKMLETGEEQILRILQEGDIFAEVVLFDQGPYPATAEVIEDAKIGMIKSEDVNELIKENPEIAIKILNVMSKRLRQAQMKIRDLGLKDTRGRTASMLIKLAEEYGKDAKEGIELDLSLTREEFANLIGTSRETITRILSDFKDDGLVKVGRKKIVILDLESLKEWS